MGRIKRVFWHMYTLIVRRKFGLIGSKTVLLHPLQLDETSSIYIEHNVNICENAWLIGNKDKDKSLYIGSGTSIGHFAHIVAKKMVTIEQNVLIADRVFISDCTHKYVDVSEPIIKQDIDILNSLTIGEGSWIGEGVCVIGASIGKHSVVGANSVVTKDIPDYSIAVGTPARVIKKYDFVRKEWIRYDNK